MLFNVESDTGDRIVGYVVPDTFSAAPRVRLTGGDQELLVMEANDHKRALVDAGRHETGLCGFDIDATLLPNIATLEDLAIWDVETGVLIYRRPVASFVPRKLVRIETHLFPLWRLDGSVQRNFQYFSRAIENLGRETVTQLFLLTNSPSVYVSGRILYKPYAYYIEADFQSITLVQDPYRELAERLLILGELKPDGLESLGMRDSMGLRNAAIYVLEFPLESDNVKEVKRALQRMPNDVAATFANPLTRQLTAGTPDEMPTSGAIAASLDTLASFALVGLRERPDVFRAGLAELVGQSVDAIPEIPHFPRVERLAAILKETAAVDNILEKDRELYHYVSQAAAEAT